MYAIHDEAVEDGTLIRRRIRRILEARQAIHIGELRMRLGLTEEQVRHELAVMTKAGEVECMRPVRYERNDRDFFRLRETDEVVGRIIDPIALSAAFEARQNIRVSNALLAAYA